MRYGWRGVGLPDQRDNRFAYRNTFKSVMVPQVKYLICGPVVDQGDIGSCVFFSLVAHMVATAVQNDIAISEIPNLSQLFAYYRYRAEYGDVLWDDGAFIRDAIKIMAKGVCLEDCWPYVIKNFPNKPPASCYQEAEKHKILSYHALYTIEDMLQCMASGYGFVGGISVYESFDSLMTEKTGVVEIPRPNEKLLGGHALYFGGGYNLHWGMIKFQNSWGEGWGDKGFGWIPIEYLTNPGLAGSFFTIRR